MGEIMVTQRYNSLNPRIQTNQADLPIMVNELFDLYYSLGPTRSIKKLHDAYLNHCDSKGFVSSFSLTDVCEMVKSYEFETRVKLRVKEIEEVADERAVEKVLPEKIALKRRQLARTNKMVCLAEDIIDTLAKRIYALETADLKTASEYLRIAQKMLEYGHKEERDIVGNEDGDTLTKAELMELVPIGFQNYLETEAKKLLGEL